MGIRPLSGGARGARRADFAEALLPHVLTDLALHVVDLEGCHQLSKQAYDIIPHSVLLDYLCTLLPSTLLVDVKGFSKYRVLRGSTLTEIRPLLSR